MKRSDVKRFYNRLADERILTIATIDNVHTVLHQVFNLAVDDGYIRLNPTDNMLKELKQSHNFQVEKRKALTIPEQQLFINFLKNHPVYRHWYPVFAIMLGTGLRVGELIGLRWCDIDLDEGLIHVNHTLVYYNHGDGNGCSFSINTPKTKAGERTVPMMDDVKEAFLLEKQNQEDAGVKCKAIVDCYTDFIFINRYGDVQHQGTLNKALRRIIRDCNFEVLDKVHREDAVILPKFSNHSLRHTFATRALELGMDIKTLSEILGHTNVGITLNRYAHSLYEFKIHEMNKLSTLL